MGRQNYFKPGSYYRVDDRSGFVFRAEDTAKEWQGLIVAKRFWEPRQPQDLVRGVRDDQTVPEARPRPTVQYIGPAQTTLSMFASEGSEYIVVNSPFSYAVGNKIGITLNFDKGVIFWCTIISGAGAFSHGFNRGYQRYTATPGRAGDFNQDENSDFSEPVVTGTPILISRPLPGPANSGNWVVNASTPEITPDSYGSSSGG